MHDIIDFDEKLLVVVCDLIHLFWCFGRESTRGEQGVVPVEDRQVGRLSGAGRASGRVPDARVRQLAQVFVSWGHMFLFGSLSFRRICFITIRVFICGQNSLTEAEAGVARAS